MTHTLLFLTLSVFCRKSIKYFDHFKTHQGLALLNQKVHLFYRVKHYKFEVYFKENGIAKISFHVLIATQIQYICQRTSVNFTQIDLEGR